MAVLRAMLGCAAFCLAGWLHAAPIFTIGVPPTHNTRVLVEGYESLRFYLEKALQQPVRVESAPDFARYQARSLRGEFDLTITSAHFARMLQKDAEFQPLAQFSPDHEALLIMNADRPLASPQDMRGKELAVIDRLAITVMAALAYLDGQGLEADIDYRVTEHRTHASVAQSVGIGLSAAAVTTRQGVLQMPAELRGKIVVYKHIAAIPAFVFLAKPDVDKAQAERLKTLLLEFPWEFAGIDFLRRIGYAGIKPVTEADMKRGDAYLKEARRALKP